uniref:Rho GTPase activating protein 28 n=1 Tax=Cyprinus carpio TaxID=7962 RepID=A0A8C1LH68_CYPCA
MHLMQTLMCSVSLCFCRKAQYQRIGSMSLSPSAPERCVSRDSMEDYWSEMKSIEEERQGGPEEQTERSSMDEAELEEAWLQEAGLSTLVTGTQSDGPAEALLSTLTRSQAAMVKKRLDNYTQTLRKRNRQPTRHVRDVFSTPDASSEPTPPISPNGQIALRLPQWNTPKVPPPCAADTNGSGSASETILLSFDVPYSEAARAHRKGRECQDCRRIRKDDRDSPVFQIVRPRQGVTRVRDLSSEDIKKIGYISLIELTTFYDFLSIEMKRNRVVRSRARGAGIFGVPLTTLLENDQKKSPGSRVPLVFKKVLYVHLSFFGLSERPKQHLIDAVNEISPLFVPQRISSPKHQIQALHLLIMLLPEANRDTLKALLEFLRKVVAYEEKNRMSLWNVSMIVAPNLFTFRGKNAKQEEMQGAVAAAQLVRLLITHQDLLWTVPCFLISHVRKMNEAAMGKKTPASEKSKRRLLKRWSMEKERERSEVTDLRDGVIRVHAPLHAKVSMAIQLNAEMKARDITARFDGENGRGSRSASRRQRQYLFEIGGNIGERCLDPDAHLLDVYRVNPHCEWVLKSWAS